MKLRLKNFRSYSEREFDFGQNGIVLLTGMSGSGKSTICMAVNFALYGTGTKLTTFGKTSCLVELTFSSLKITRTKRPNRLVLTDLDTGEDYEDDSAQGIINNKFGTTFDIVSYVKQNALNSFIVMGPLEKLSFLEKFAFQDIDIAKIKTRVQTLIKQRNEELITVTSQLEMATEHLESLTKPEKVTFPLRTKDKQKSIKNTEIRCKNAKIMIKRTEKALEAVKKELTELRIFSAKLDGEKKAIFKLEDKIIILKDEIDAIEYIGDEKVFQYEEQLHLLLSRKELIVLQDRLAQDEKRLDTMKGDERIAIKGEIDNIDGSIWQEYSEEEATQTITEYKNMLKDIDRLERHRKNMKMYFVDEKDLKEKIDKLQNNRLSLTKKKDDLSRLLLQEEIYVCPSCDVKLRFEDNELFCAEDTDIEFDRDSLQKRITAVKKEISSLECDISRLEYSIPEEQSKFQRYLEAKESILKIEQTYEEELPGRKEAEDNIDYLQEYIRSQKDLDRQREKFRYNLDNGIYSTSLGTFTDQLEKQRKSISTLQSKMKGRAVDVAVNEEELRAIIVTQRNNKEKISALRRQLDEAEKDLFCHREKEREISSRYLTEYNEIREAETIQEEISSEESKLTVHKNDLVEYTQLWEKIQGYLKYKEEIEKYTEWEEKITDLQKKETRKRKSYSAVTLLKEKILQAESIAISNIITSINIHSQVYLDLFFPVDPIVVRLLSFKTTKKNSSKPQINLEIDYKGNQCDITSLSGGELSRVILAYTLSLAEMFNSPLILLDECTASLDEDLTGKVMEGIKDNFSNKLVIVIAHQVVEGNFDRKISL